MYKFTKKYTTFLAFCLIFQGIFFSFFAHADTELRGVTIDAQVGDTPVVTPTTTPPTPTPNPGGGFPPPPPPQPQGDTQPPIILSVVSTPATDSVYIVSTAIDNVAVTECTFTYVDQFGVTHVLTPTRNNDQFTIDIINLDRATTYTFTITCRDAANNTVTGTYTFRTNENLSPPIISNVQTAVTQTSGQTTWVATDDSGSVNCTYVYDNDQAGEPYRFSNTVSKNGNNFTTNVTGLLPATQYYFLIICVDPDLHVSTSAGSFTTTMDEVPPPAVLGLYAVPGDQMVRLFWQYPDTVSDFSAYIIRRSIAPITRVDQGIGIGVIRNQSVHTLLDSGLTNGTRYYYALFVRDTSGNNSAGAFTSAIPVGVSLEVCSDGQDNDTDGRIDCADPDCATDMLCVSEEMCTNGIDDDGNGLIDCADARCSSQSVCMIPAVEICIDGIDNDGNGLIDCADTECALQAICLTIPPACADNIDNDGDGLIDMSDPGCVSMTDTDESDIRIPIPDTVIVQNRDIGYLLAERTIDTILTIDTLHVLNQDHVSIVLRQDALADFPVENILLRIGQNMYPMTYDTQQNSYIADFIAPAVGNHRAQIEINYAGNYQDILNIPILSFAYAVVTDASTDQVISGARVTIETQDALWNASLYRQQNPVQTGMYGRYGFVVPNGTYDITVEKEGYRTRTLHDISVTDHILAIDIAIIPEGEDLRAFLQATVDVIDNDRVESVTQNIVAPSLVVLVSAIILPSIWSSLLPLLHYLFTQPILLFGRKKRKRWGIIYNSLDKLPIDLAIVRLIDFNTKRVVQTRVTDTEGRFLFIADPGTYLIEVTKDGFAFPSEILKQVTTDGSMVDIYHGEQLQVTESDTVLTPNIPLDPIGVEQKTPKRIILEKYLIRIRSVVGVVGIVASIIAFIIVPSVLLGMLIFVHIGLYFGFRRIALTKKPQGWGIVYDQTNNHPVKKVVARLYSRTYNKLIATQVTDRNGQFAFLVGPSDYYVTFEHPEYKKTQTGVIGAHEVSRTGIIKPKVALSK